MRLHSVARSVVVIQDKIGNLSLETVPGDSLDIPLLQNILGNVEYEVLEAVDFDRFIYYFR